MREQFGNGRAVGQRPQKVSEDALLRSQESRSRSRSVASVSDSIFASLWLLKGFACVFACRGARRKDVRMIAVVAQAKRARYPPVHSLSGTTLLLQLEECRVRPRRHDFNQDT